MTYPKAINKMKKILGLDLGTTSVGWSLVEEAEKPNEKSKIIRSGVRVVPLSSDEIQSFEKGQSITTNADRTLKRGARRNLQRFIQRRHNLIAELRKIGFITNQTRLSEEDQDTHSTYELRAKAVEERISKEDFSRVLLMINKKRGYKSNRKVNTSEEGEQVSNIDLVKVLKKRNITPGKYVYELIQKDEKLRPKFYHSDYIMEFDQIWDKQSEFYKELNDKLKDDLSRKNQIETRKILEKYLNSTAKEFRGKRTEKEEQRYAIRAKAYNEKLPVEELIEVLSFVNADIKNSDDYLGKISDRSKQIYFEGKTVGQYQYQQLKIDKHIPLKNQVFYRSDYINEFEKIWDEQSKHYPELTNQLKEKIRDQIIFYQRPLKSQKGLIGYCEFESKEIQVEIDGKLKSRKTGSKVIPRSSPLFQEFKIWSILNNIIVTNIETGENFELDEDCKDQLFRRLKYVDKLTSNQALQEIFEQHKNLELNYEEIEGHKTNAKILEAFNDIFELSGHEKLNFKKDNTVEIEKGINTLIDYLNINPEILSFDAELDGDKFHQQTAYQFWHLLYSYVGDDSNTGIEKLKEKLREKFNCPEEYCDRLASIHFDEDDYGKLSAKAIRKILPHLKEGFSYDQACQAAGYNHSSSETKEDSNNKKLNDRLNTLPKNSLRNPVVEKILNQMINVVNAVCDEYGKPEEIRIELARELKKSAKERANLTKSINDAQKRHAEIRKKLQKEFGLKHVSRNDIVKYKLYEELKPNGYKTLYTHTYIAPEQLFTADIDIEHIIPQSRFFDDSFSNKTLAFREVNIKKGSQTAYDFLASELSKDEFEAYKQRLKLLRQNGNINKAKYDKLMMTAAKIPDGFIERDLRNSQYIAKKAKELLSETFRAVSTTTGSITSRLRSDWGIDEVLKELNWEKYNQLDLTRTFENRHGKKIRRIEDWTKRSDHRHHAMDAITVAFTKPSHVQYLNHLNARKNDNHKYAFTVQQIEKKELERDKNNKLRFIPPMPTNEFRKEVKEQLSSILVSYKTKNKVTTRNKNKTKVKGGYKTNVILTPRGQLHKETVYGKIQQYLPKVEKVGGNFDATKIKQVANKKYREALEKRLREFEGDPKRAFTGKNSLSKNPIYLNATGQDKLPEKVKVVEMQDVYTIRKAISPDLKVEKVVDKKVQRILKERISKYGNEKKAFSNLDDDPIWLNEEKGIQIKRVTITGVSNAIALHDKKDLNGKLITCENKTQPVDFVSEGNNHHIPFFLDDEGNLQDGEAVSFYEAVTRKIQGLPIIDKTYNSDLGWKFLFSLKQNECFVFPNKESGFNPAEIDLLNQNNYPEISKNLFRVQKISRLNYGKSIVRDYVFRHHLETQLDDRKELKDITYKSIKSNSYLVGVVKVRLNHLGEIVHVGEY